MNEYAQRIVLLTAEQEIVRLAQRLIDSNQRMFRTLNHGGDAQRSVFAADVIERGRRNGPLREEPLMFVGLLINSMADATIDFISTDPDNAEHDTVTAFEAMWRVMT
ncbi:protein of unknown function (plasmid) [Pararobbsia alpina]|uniref:hypothetical protein n=1 Tax=Pararobbsia alpina TaxID=621374 RepID=UPI0039A564F9